MSGVRRIEAETRRVCKMEATTAEAKSVRGKVQSRVASFVASADVNVLRVAEEIVGRVKEVAADSDAQALRVAAEVMQ